MFSRSKRHTSFVVDDSVVPELKSDDLKVLDPDFNESVWNDLPESDRLEISRTLYVSKGTPLIVVVVFEGESVHICVVRVYIIIRAKVNPRAEPVFDGHQRFVVCIFFFVFFIYFTS
jgi:hypothetical protein